MKLTLAAVCVMLLVLLVLFWYYPHLRADLDDWFGRFTGGGIGQ